MEGEGLIGKGEWVLVGFERREGGSRGGLEKGGEYGGGGVGASVGGGFVRGG